jgi:signal transduction histidine kinase
MGEIDGLEEPSGARGMAFRARGAYLRDLVHPRDLKTWPIAAAALLGLLALIAGSLLATASRAEVIYAELDALNNHHRQIETKLRRLRSDVHLSGIYIRDYLLDPSRDRVPEYRARLTELRTSHLAAVGELEALTRGDGVVHIEGLSSKLDDYWRTFEPVFDWNVLQKLLNSAAFLRREVIPRRDAVLTIAQEIEELNDANMATQRAAVARRQEAFRDDLRRLLWQSVLLGTVVALAAVLRLRLVERRSEEQQVRAEEAEAHLRHLSQGLVSMQEDERRKLSRELHDHVGQMLTALRMALGRIERVGTPAERSEALIDARSQVEELLQTVRDLALGLRPSMLDDFGLAPALEWLGRDFQRRTGLDVRVSMSGPMSVLNEAQRTCIYRVVQEALTNVVRHAGAAGADVAVTFERRSVIVTIQDDGRGLPPARRGAGLGLVGIEERARDLGGTFVIGPGVPSGTRLQVRLPMHPASSEEATHAAVAG